GAARAGRAGAGDPDALARGRRRGGGRDGAAARGGGGGGRRSGAAQGRALIRIAMIVLPPPPGGGRKNIQGDPVLLGASQNEAGFQEGRGILIIPVPVLALRGFTKLAFPPDALAVTQPFLHLRLGLVGVVVERAPGVGPRVDGENLPLQPRQG